MSGGEASPRAAIAGMGATPYYFRGASHPQTLYELVCKSVLAAVADGGIELRDIDGMACYSTAFEPALITQSLGIPDCAGRAIRNARIPVFRVLAEPNDQRS